MLFLFPASSNDVFIQGPLQILDILTIFLKGCLLVHPSLSSSRVKMLLVRRKLASESISNTGKTCFSSCPSPRSVSREFIWYLLSQLAWTNTGRTCSSYCLFSPPLVLELGLQSNPLDLLDPPLPSAKILLETCFFESWFDSFDTWWSP